MNQLQSRPLGLRGPWKKCKACGERKQMGKGKFAGPLCKPCWGLVKRRHNAKSQRLALQVALRALSPELRKLRTLERARQNQRERKALAWAPSDTCDCGQPKNSLAEGCAGCTQQDQTGNGTAAAIVATLRILDGWATTQQLADEIGHSKRNVLRACAVLLANGRVRRRVGGQDLEDSRMEAWWVLI